LIKLSFTLGWLAICNAALAILMPWYVVTRLGVGVETDAFFASGALPQLIFLVISTSLAHVLVPLLATEDEEIFRRDALSFFLGITLLFSLIAVLLFATSSYWVPLLVPGFSVAGKTLTVRLTRIQLISMVFNASVVVLWSFYHARQKFIWAELSPVLANIVSLLFLFWTLPRFGIYAAAWTIVLNNGVKIALLLPVMGRWQRPSWRSPTMKEAWRRTRPFLLGQTYYKTDPLIDRLLTSLGREGGLSLLYIGQQIYAVSNQIINKAISAPMVPMLAIEAKAGRWDRYRRIYRERLLWMAVLTGTGCLLLLLMGQPILHLAVGHGGITANNVRTLWLVMIALSGVLAGGAVGQITSVAFYAMGDTRTPTRLFILTYTFYIPLKIMIYIRYGMIGLAMGTSFYFLLNFVLQIFILERSTLRRERGWEASNQIKAGST
jgi:peptidoglycan biosynthesis protein MviN/MurJ (putative lipid II flippase)